MAMASRSPSPARGAEDSRPSAKDDPETDLSKDGEEKVQHVDDNKGRNEEEKDLDRRPRSPQDGNDRERKLSRSPPPKKRSSRTPSPGRKRHRSRSRSITPVLDSRRRSETPPVRSRERDRERDGERDRDGGRDRSRDGGRSRRERSRSPYRRSRSPVRRRSRSPRRSSPRRRSRSRDRYGYGSYGGRKGSDYSKGNGLGRPGNNLFVAGFNFITNERDLEKKFAKYGKVLDVRIVRDPRSRESRGFGFVTLERDEDADDAIRGEDQATWNGRVVLVEKAKNPR